MNNLSRKAFTIIELLICIVGLLVLSGIGFVAFLVIKILWNLAFGMSA